MEGSLEVEDYISWLEKEARQKQEYSRQLAKRCSEYGVPGFEQLAKEQSMGEFRIPNLQDSNLETTNPVSEQSQVDLDEMINEFQIAIKTLDTFDFPERLTRQRSSNEKLPIFLSRVDELRRNIWYSIFLIEKNKTGWNRHFHSRCRFSLPLKEELMEYLKLQLASYDIRVNIIYNWGETGQAEEESEELRQTSLVLKDCVWRLFSLTSFANEKCREHTNDNKALEDPPTAGTSTPGCSIDIDTNSDAGSPATMSPSTIKESPAEAETTTEPMINEQSSPQVSATSQSSQAALSKSPIFGTLNPSSAQVEEVEMLDF